MKRPAALDDLTRRWQALDAREQTLLRGAAGLLALALLWWLAIAPALATLRQAGARQSSLEAQWQQMQRLQAEARALQGLPRPGHDEALRTLEVSVRQRLGAAAQLQLSGERATLTLKGAPADALAEWLTQARVNARLVPAEARLQRSADADAPSWDGQLVLTLPPR
ncbi:type II secretion system protein GspM [Ramlibacter sp. 2FC]|uniref:type II secretion system protein GspM n=1 Tax=Ramlibacter sp. 2FC TaxID=2502188 RepID=UPI0010F78F97|nr:type II secretion system protein GspM [Ramlibacter sp. 2FC]